MPQQIALLTDRGLVIPDQARAEHYLNFIGYYRLSGYTRFFADPGDRQGERFLPDTTFDQVLDLYVYDRKMRVLLLDDLERIEIAIKASISNTGSLRGADGAFWLENPINFDHGRHPDILAVLEERCGNKAGNSGVFGFIRHFFLKYSDSYPPSWMAMEAMTFGNVSHIYKRMKGSLRLPIAQAFSLQHDVLESWLHALAFARNACAHHARVWNQKFTIWPKIPKHYANDWPSAAQDRLYVLCCIIHHLMEVIADGSKWSERLRALIEQRPSVPLAEMGFPADWEKRPFWKFPN